jgi:2-methylcitrate synthase
MQLDIIGASKGPLHGGANEAVMHTFDEIGSAHRAEAWLEEALASKCKIMGFGHGVYMDGDSWVPIMKAELDALVDYCHRPELRAPYTTLEAAMMKRKDLLPNVDYPCGPVYHLIGFETATFMPLFVASRIAGWTAHIMEQLQANALKRPLSSYNGLDERHVMIGWNQREFSVCVNSHAIYTITKLCAK